MYLWRVDRLVEDFRNDQVTEREKLKYMILYGICLVVGIQGALWAGQLKGLEYSYVDTVNVLIAAVINVYGTYYCYAKNRDGDNRDLITRFLCIGLPVAIRVFVFFIPAFVLVGVVVYRLRVMHGIGTGTNELGQSVSYTTWLDVLLDAAFSAVMYLYLATKMAAVARVAPASEQG
ncbi:MAG: hypothetical protein AB1473_19445 [Thermodesulfobacteriota bacterium]